MNIARIFLLKFSLLFSIGGINTLRFANYYHSHMVLQMSPKRAQIWGYAATVGDFIHVKINGTEVGKVIAKQRHDGTGGIWSALLPPQHAGGPVTISIVSPEGHAVITDVLFGDVWVCSGQSNMKFGLGNVFNHTDEVKHASHFHNIRFMKIFTNTSSFPLSEPVVDTQWQSPMRGNDAPTRTFSAVCLLYAMELSPHINRPIGLVESAWGGTPVETWSSPDALANCAQHMKRSPRKESVIWNAMIHPILRMTIYGAIWYQGEDNRKNPEEYACRFPAMIDDWRSKFHLASRNQTNEKFPFGFVQLAPLGNFTDFHSGFPDVRWAQTAEYGYVPNPRQQNVFMAVAMDLPDFNSTLGAGHPRDKQDVAERLALAGRAVAYGNSNIDFQGPVPNAFTLVGHKLTIEFDHGDSAVEIRTNKGFEVCCRAGQHGMCSAEKWTPAAISGHDLNSVTIDTSVCHGNQNVVRAVRYAWVASPCEFKKCAIYDRNNDLPAPPFVKIGPFGLH